MWTVSLHCGCSCVSWDCVSLWNSVHTECRWNFSCLFFLVKKYFQAVSELFLQFWHDVVSPQLGLKLKLKKENIVLNHVKWKQTTATPNYDHFYKIRYNYLYVTEVFLRDLFWRVSPFSVCWGRERVLTRQTCHLWGVRDRQFLQRKTWKKIVMHSSFEFFVSPVNTNAIVWDWRRSCYRSSADCVIEQRTVWETGLEHEGELL